MEARAIMKEIKVRVRPDGKDYEDVVIGTITWGDDIKASQKASEYKVNAETLQREKVFNIHILNSNRLVSAEQTSFLSIEKINDMPAKDVELLLTAYNQLNTVSADEKRSLLGGSSSKETSGATEGTVKRNAPTEPGLPNESEHAGEPQHEAKRSGPAPSEVPGS